MAKQVQKKKIKKEARESDIKANKDKLKAEALEERLRALERIQAEHLKPKSEVRVTGKRFFPIVVGGFFAAVSGVAVYGVASAVRFYGDYGDLSSLVWSLVLFAMVVGFISLAAWAIHRSEWGYRLRYAVVVMIAVASSIGLGAVLMQEPVERIIDRVGIAGNLRAEDRILNSSTVYGRILVVDEDRLVVDLVGGQSLEAKLSSSTKIFPREVKLKNGQLVAVILKNETNEAVWVRVLPSDHPSGRDLLKQTKTGYRNKR